MILHCYGGHCPFKEDCYRYTQPNPGRDAFGNIPYNTETNHCEYFYSNIPSEELIRQTAYFIWQGHGRPENSAQQDWDEAYRSLCESLGRTQKE